jgi:hypothetical protein
VRGLSGTVTADEAAAAPRGWRAVWPRLAWTAAAVATGVVLFWCYLRQSQTTAVNADGSGMALQGWDMLHGNLLLSGWWLADVTFYTFEIPVDALVEAVHGLDADVVHISAALIYTLLAATAALLAKGTARGTEGIIRALLGAGVMVAPAVSPATRILILSPDHTGVGVPILLTLLLMDRAPAGLCQQESPAGLCQQESRARWWVPLAICVLLVWAQVDDPLATVAAAVPIAIVCLVRACVLLVRRRRSAWHAPLLFDGALAVAAVASVRLASLAVAAIKSAGGYSMQPLGKIGKLLPSAVWGHQLWVTGENVLILFGADFYEQPAGIRTVIAFLHFAGLVLAACGLLIGIAGLVRGADRVTQILTVATLATLGAGAFVTQMLPVQGAHDIAVVLPFGAVLAGRTLGPWLVRRRLPKITLLPLLGVALACYLAALGYNASQPASQPAMPAETQGLADWLAAHHLTSGLGKYWVANSTTLASGGRVRVAPAQFAADVAYPWVTKPSWYDPAVSTANFVIATPGTGNAYAFSEAVVQHSFGKPSRVYRYGTYVVMVWNRNLLLQVPPPNQSQVDGR